MKVVLSPPVSMSHSKKKFSVIFKNTYSDNSIYVDLSKFYFKVVQAKGTKQCNPKVYLLLVTFIGKK